MKLQKGDIIEMPLPNGNKVLSQFIRKDKWGDIIVVFSTLPNKEFKENITSKNILIGPVITRLKLGLESKDFKWKVVKNLQQVKTPPLVFIWKEGGYGAKDIATRWYLYDGVENKILGEKLPDEYKKTEYLVSYSPKSLIDRIVTGQYLEKELIKKG